MSIGLSLVEIDQRIQKHKIIPLNYFLFGDHINNTVMESIDQGFKIC